MNRTLSLVLAVGSLAASALVAADPRPRSTVAAPRGGDPAALPMVVSAAWLALHVRDPDVVILHAGDAGAYRKQHIAGARRVALGDISVSDGEHGGLTLELPPAEALRGRLEALGISNRSRIVVCFAPDWLASATRIVFTLDAAGLGAHTALLDGGLAAWQAAGYAVTEAVPPPRTGALAPLAMRPIVVDAATVLTSLGKPGFAVVDARDRVFYDGTQTGGSPQHPHRTGHIAGALSIPFDSVFDARGALRPDDDLRARFASAGVAPGATVIGYCHIGQQATALLFVARRLGHPVLLYDGAFEDWSLFHPGYPVEAKPEARR